MTFRFSDNLNQMHSRVKVLLLLLRLSQPPHHLFPILRLATTDLWLTPEQRWDTWFWVRSRFQEIRLQTCNCQVCMFFLDKHRLPHCTLFTRVHHGGFCFLIIGYRKIRPSKARISKRVVPLNHSAIGLSGCSFGNSSEE